MGIFDDLAKAGKAAAMVSVSEMAGEDWPAPFFTFTDSVFHAVDEVVPEEVDGSWCAQVVSERPDLWDLDASGESLAEALRNAVRDLILKDIDSELQEHARSIGLDIGDDESPRP